MMAANGAGAGGGGGGGGRTLLDMNRYQWTVLFAAWLGWGFDVFDGLLFNFVAPNAVPTAYISIVSISVRMRPMRSAT